MTQGAIIVGVAVATTTEGDSSSDVGADLGVLAVPRYTNVADVVPQQSAILPLLPAPEVSGLRQRQLQLGNHFLAANESITLAGASGFGQRLEMAAFVVPSDGLDFNVDTRVLQLGGG